MRYFYKHMNNIRRKNLPTIFFYLICNKISALEVQDVPFDNSLFLGKRNHRGRILQGNNNTHETDNSNIEDTKTVIYYQTN